MNSGFDLTYYPRPEIAAVYQKLYQKYLNAGGFIETGMKAEQYTNLNAV
jgi:L-ribulokinase